MYPTIIKVIPQENYQLLLTFDNGEKRVFDVKPFLNWGLFQELKNIDIFNTVKTSFDTIEWENEADLDPEILYLESKAVE
jgi:hypothetical protein